MASGHRNGPARGIQRGVVVTKSSSTAITPRTGFLFVLRSLGQAFEGSNCGLGKPGASLSRHSGKEIIWRQKSEARNRKSQSKTVRRRVEYLTSLRDANSRNSPRSETSVRWPLATGHCPTTAESCKRCSLPIPPNIIYFFIQPLRPPNGVGSQTTITHRFFLFRGGWRATGSGTSRAFNNPRGSSPAPGRVPSNIERA